MDDKKFVLIFFGIVAVIITGYLLFWGTVVAIAGHFIHKYW